MPIAFDRSICCDLNETISREWLVTNGLGGYAAGTVAGMLTRLQHGLLVASPTEADAAAPQLLLAKIDEEIVFDERTYYLGTNEFTDGTMSPSGFAHLETFRLEEGFPVFTYHLGGIDGIMLEKRIWMPYGYNTTYIQYRVLRSRTDPDTGNTDIDRPGGSAYGLPGHDTARRDKSGPGNSGTGSYGYTVFPAYPEASQRVLSLTLLPFSAYRPHHQPQYGNNDLHFQVQVHSGELPTATRTELDWVPAPLQLPRGVAGCTIRAWDGALPYAIFAVGHPDSQTTFIPTGVWYWHFLHRHDQAAGRSAVDDLYLPGVIRTKLWPGEDTTLTIIVTSEELSSLTFSPDRLDLSYKRSLARQIELASSFLQPQRYFGEGGETSHSISVLPLSPLQTSSAVDEDRDGEAFLRLLLQAADRFLIQRHLPRGEQRAFERLFFRTSESMPVILSDYYGLEDSTRDTLIALPGLTLVTKRYDEARYILHNLARYFQRGMLPGRLPSFERPLEEHDYGSVDTTLWYFYALDQYLQATQDYVLLDDLYQRLVESIDWYVRGTYNGIQVDASDGLLRATQPGKALTWMNASVHGVPVTPRQGKPVEVNALWYHALSLMHEWSQRHQRRGGSISSTSYTPSYYKELATRCKQSFHQRFLGRDQPDGRDQPRGRNELRPYIYDVIDGPDGDDASMRPNQLLAFSLRYPLLDEEYRQDAFDLVTEQLVTPFGLRTLAPQEAGYRGELMEDQLEQQRALHQGSVWPWLIGPYIDAMLNIQEPIPTKNSACIANQSDYHGQRELLWKKGIAVLEPFRKQFSTGLLGMIGGVFHGDTSQYMAYEPASALSVAEILRVYDLFVRQQIEHPVDLLSVNHGIRKSQGTGNGHPYYTR